MVAWYHVIGRKRYNRVKINLMVKIIKKSGQEEEFSEKKVRLSLRRAGTPPEIRDKIIKKLLPCLHKGITTTAIYQLVYDWLKEEEAYLAAHYNLRQAVMDLGPTGYPFESFLAGILRHYQYQTMAPQSINGRCIKHEIDIIALSGKKDLFQPDRANNCYMIECKFHNKGGTKTAAKSALYTYARFLDVKSAEIDCFSQKVKPDGAILATNTKITSEVKKYCRCVGMKVLAWNYPKETCLAKLVEESGLYPLTCLASLTQREKQRLLQKGIVFCRELLLNEDWRYLTAKNHFEQIKKEAQEVISHKL